MHRLISAVLFTVAGVCPLASAAQGTDSVWVNTRSQVYHCPGTEYYGKTARGEYLSEAEARARGHRANGGRRCTADTPVQGFVTRPEGEAPPSALPPTMPATGLQSCTIEKITDGDTFVCSGIGSVRPIGYDVPEKGQEPFYTAARAALASLVPRGAVVQLEYDDNRTDRFGRTLAYLWYEGRLINWVMVRQGWGVAYPFPDTPRYTRPLAEAEAAARQEQRGLWFVDGFRCPPGRRGATCR